VFDVRHSQTHHHNVMLHGIWFTGYDKCGALKIYVPLTLIANRHCGSVHHESIFTQMTNKMQLCRIIHCTLTALHVSSDIFAHHQEHVKCNYSFGFIHVFRCQLLLWHGMQMCRIVYCSFTALHVSNNIFPHHQEHVTCNYRFWFYSRVWLSAADLTWHANE
jgi:hypothetical protein